MPGPLSGIVVLDVSHVLAGPFAAATLTDLDARVDSAVQHPPGHSRGIDNAPWYSYTARSW